MWIVCIVATAVPVSAASCNTSPVFAFSQVLYLGQYEAARRLLPGIKRQRGAEIAQFLHQALRFKRAYETGSSAGQQAALDEIDEVITSLSGRTSEKGRLKEQLNLANIMIHTARLQLALGNVLRAAKMANQGKHLLDESLEQNPHNVDTLLANGLYHYYTGSENQALGWIMRLWSLQGDKARGREMIEKAVENSADHAFEAARSLLSDVTWNRQDTCRYLPLFSDLEPLDMRSFTAFQEQVALFLFCGQAEQALEKIMILEALSERIANRLSGPQSGWLFEARLHALAALGDVEQLNETLASIDQAANQSRYRQTQFALAKGLDTRGAHENAEALYHEVIASDIASRYRTLAQSYLQRPYEKTRPFQYKSGNQLQFACGSG